MMPLAGAVPGAVALNVALQNMQNGGTVYPEWAIVVIGVVTGAMGTGMIWLIYTEARSAWKTRKSVQSQSRGDSEKSHRAPESGSRRAKDRKRSKVWQSGAES